MRTTSPHIHALHSRWAARISYPWWTRLVDGRWIGRRDADAALAHGPVQGDLSGSAAQPSASLRALAATLDERCELERLTAVRIAARLLDARIELGRRLDDLEHERERLLVRLGGAEAEEPTGVEHVSERHLDVSQRAARREREKARRLAPLRARRDALDAGERELRREIADIDARLTTLFEGLQARTRALTRHYERRCNTQVRGYLRRTPAAEPANHPLNVRRPLAPPAWVDGANPWLPASAD